MPQAADLRQAVIESNIKRVRVLLDSDPWLVAASSTNPENERALHVAAELGFTEIAAELISRMADVNARDDHGQTALHRAVWSGKVAMVRLLLEHGAAPLAQDKHGNTILHPPGGKAIGKAVWLLLRNTLTIHEAADLGDARMVAQMLDADPRLVNATNQEDDTYQQTPLHRAAQNGHHAVAELLIQRGADVNARDAWNETPLELAYDSNSEETVLAILAHGAEM